MEHPIALLNTSIITAPGDYTCREITADHARRLIVESASTGTIEPWVSAIGHEATAEAMSAVLGTTVPVNRIAFVQQPDQLAIVLKLRDRIPEGTVLDREALEEIGYDLWLMKRIGDY